MVADKLFEPIKVGHVQLEHRISMSPLTRMRADHNYVPGSLAAEYYAQRAVEKGTLIVTEATFISPRAAGYKNVPGIWNQDQIKGWKKVTDEIHAKGSSVFLQLWALGRVAQPKVLEEDGGFLVSGPSPIPFEPNAAVPHELTEADIQTYISEYATAAKNAIEAGFDGVEIHGANGYLIDQFWQDVSNQRTDKYGGSIENRARFGLEVTRAILAALGGDSKKVGMRLSPFNFFQGMRMEDPVPQFTYIVKELRKLDLAYLHLIETRESGERASDAVYRDLNDENRPFIEAWGPSKPLILAGGFTPEKADRVVTELYPEDNVILSFGRYFISTPDLVYRIRRGLPLNSWHRPTFYGGGPEGTGYTDYPFSDEFLAEHGRL